VLEEENRKLSEQLDETQREYHYLVVEFCSVCYLASHPVDIL
jgi:hypothetical protein